MLRPFRSRSPTRPSNSKTREILIMEVIAELRILREYVLFSFFDIAFKMAVSKIGI
jgi:hypothetical protein